VGSGQQSPVIGLAHVNGADLYYETAGVGEPLVLLHGFTLDHRMWDAQFMVFADRFQVVRYDLRGFGRSSLPDGKPYRAADDLRGLLSFLNLGPAHLLGLSMGGGEAIRFALSYPELTRSLIVSDSILGGYTWDSLGRDLKTVWSLGQNSGIEAAKAHWLGLDLFAPANRLPDVAASLQQMVGDYSGWHWQNNDSAEELVPPPIEQLEKIVAPFLAIVGELDLPDFQAIGALLAQRVPGGKLAILPGAGHMANMEAPEEFSRTVLDFLA